jgi:hypothetical protein
MTIKLYAEPECWKFKEKHPDIFSSFGCGPGGIGDFLVPDTVWGLSIKPACQIHDWYYRFYPYRTEADRKIADTIFGNNMLRIVNYYTKSRFLRRRRYIRTGIYYKAVRSLGGPAWHDEDDLDTYLKTYTSV